MTKIKLCGLSRTCDIKAANELKPDYIGFVFAKKSRRYVEPCQAAELKKLLEPQIKAVGVFVDEAPETVARLLHEETIDIAQLHGKEDEAYILRLRELTGHSSQAGDMNGQSPQAGDMNGQSPQADDMNGQSPQAGDMTGYSVQADDNTETSYPIIQAFRIKTSWDLEKALRSSADYILLDSGAGTGNTFDWNLLSDINRPWFLAGGLDPENVKEAIKNLNPWAVDVSSGIETNKIKDAKKMEEFVEAVRTANFGS